MSSVLSRGFQLNSWLFPLLDHYQPSRLGIRELLNSWGGGNVTEEENRMRGTKNLNRRQEGW